MTASVLALIIGGSGGQSLALHEAPFRIANGLLMVEARVGSVKGWFALDSGSYCSWIEPKALAKVDGYKNVDPVPKVHATAPWVEVPSLEIGGAKLDHVLFEKEMIPSGRGLPVGRGEKLSGILGYNVLRMLGFGINFDQVRAWFWGLTEGAEAPSQFFSKGAEVTSMPARADPDGQPQVDVVLNGTTMPAAMDTGSTTFWADPPSRQLMGARCLEGSHDNSLAWDRKIDGTTLYADSLSFGGVTVTTPIVRTSSSRDGAILGWTSLAVLHRVLFDLDGSSIQFEKPTGQLSGIQPWAYAQGLATDSHGNLISGNSPAGDVPGSTPPEGVSSIDGIGVDRLFRGAETPWNERALDMQSAVESWKGEPQFILQGGKHVGLSVLGPDFRYGPGKLLPAGQGDDNSDDLFADGPGTYFWKPGARPVRCWAGTLTLPAGETWTVQSVGGVPQPKPGASGAYEIPDTSWLWPQHVLDSSASAFLAAGGEPYVPPLYAGVQRTYHRDGSVTDAFSSGAVLTWLLPRSDRYGSAVKLGQLPVLCLHDAKGEVKTPAGSTYSPLPGGGGWLLPRGWTLGSDEAPAPPAK